MANLNWGTGKQKQKGTTGKKGTLETFLSVFRDQKTGNKDGINFRNKGIQANF